MKKIDINECHKLLLGIAKEFDAICTKHNIPYYMLGGTMLGAIRHKGFIPWDDDMDFGVPRTQYTKLIEILERELPVPLKCCTYINSKAVKSPFAKIVDTRTIIDDPRIDLPVEQQIGINIDIFPLDCCDLNDNKIKTIRKWEKLSQLVYINPPHKSYTKLLIKKILRLICPFSHKYILDKICKLALSLEKGEFLANIHGRWKNREIIPVEWYGEYTRYDFEGIKLCGIKEYDKYLSKLYNNYMQLPPVEKRIAHVDNIYMKDKES